MDQRARKTGCSHGQSGGSSGVVDVVHSFPCMWQLQGFSCGCSVPVDRLDGEVLPVFQPAGFFHATLVPSPSRPYPPAVRWTVAGPTFPELSMPPTKEGSCLSTKNWTSLVALIRPELSASRTEGDKPGINKLLVYGALLQGRLRGPRQPHSTLLLCTLRNTSVSSDR